MVAKAESVPRRYRMTEPRRFLPGNSAAPSSPGTAGKQGLQSPGAKKRRSDNVEYNARRASGGFVRLSSIPARNALPPQTGAVHSGREPMEWMRGCIPGWRPLPHQPRIKQKLRGRQPVATGP